MDNYQDFALSYLGEAGWGQDARREKALSELGLRVIRFRNDEVVRELSPTLRFGDASQSAVVGKIRELFKK